MNLSGRNLAPSLNQCLVAFSATCSPVTIMVEIDYTFDENILDDKSNSIPNLGFSSD
jgi:hypothetical protein